MLAFGSLLVYLLCISEALLARATYITSTHSFSSTTGQTDSVSSTGSSTGSSTESSSRTDSVSSTVSSTNTLSSSSTAVIPSTTDVARKNPKRGLAFAAGDSPGDINNANQTASAVTWQYNWANIPPSYLATSNIPFIPMQWGSGAIDKFVDVVRAQGAQVILGFNEPDYSAESNIDPVQAASLWMRHIEPLKEHGVRLGGPSVTASGTGRPWLQRFFAACSNCTIDFLPVHWYGTGTAGFYDYLWSIHNDFPRLPIWVTEYADTSDNDADVYNFMNETLRYLDQLEWVERYAWFGFFRPKPDVHYSMLRDDGGLNALGELYFGAKTVHTQIISNTAFAGYKTVDGADLPDQPIVTSWPALAITSHGTNVFVNSVQLFGLVVLVLGTLMNAV